MRSLILFLGMMTVCLAQSTYTFTIKITGDNITKIELVTPTPTPSPKIGVKWSPYPKATNYRIYYGKQSGQWTTNVLTGDVTSHVFALPDNGRYYLVARPIDSSGKEMTTSNELVLN